jgi:hypothetical protein
MPEPIFMKPGMHIMAPEPISTAYFINPSHQSVCLYVYSQTLEELLDTTWRVCGSVCLPPISLLGSGSVNTFPRQRRIVGGVVFYVVLVVSKESRWFVLHRTFYYVSFTQSAYAIGIVESIYLCIYLSILLSVCLSVSTSRPSVHHTKNQHDMWHFYGNIHF